MLPPMEYTRRDLARAYLNAFPMPEHVPVDPESLAAQLKTHHRQLLRGLKQLFEVDLNSDQVLKFFFRGVAYSYRGNTHPLSGLLEAGPLLRRVEGTGTLEICDELRQLHEKSQERHIDLVMGILELVKPAAGETFTSEDLKAIGVDDEVPTDPDHLWT